MCGKKQRLDLKYQSTAKNPQALTIPELIRPRGFERDDLNDCNSNDLENQPISSATESAADSAKTPEIDPELQAIIETWPILPEPLRAAVLAIVRSGG
jgi:hypothetical protein